MCMRWCVCADAGGCMDIVNEVLIQSFTLIVDAAGTCCRPHHCCHDESRQATYTTQALRHIQSFLQYYFARL
jgi:hypothetical protein